MHIIRTILEPVKIDKKWDVEKTEINVYFNKEDIKHNASCTVCDLPYKNYPECGNNCPLFKNTLKIEEMYGYSEED